METRDSVEQAAAAWIAQRDSGPWTEKDAAAFREWLAQSAGRRAAYYRLNAAWTEAGRVRALGAGGAANLPTQAQETVPAPASNAVPRLRSSETLSARRKLNRPFAMAASILLLVVAAFAVFQDEIFHSNRFTTVVGGLQAVPMADGSRVTLNTNSQLRISLSERERVIDLDRGEAFFEVAHDPTRPFIVRVRNRRIVAVGTQFSVRREGDDVRVMVSQGAVRYEAHAGLATAEDNGSPAGSAEVFLLPAGTIARAQGDGVLVQGKPVAEIEQNLTWRSGLLTFRNTPLADAVAEFNRYNTRKIVIDDPAIAALEVGGIFRSTNLDPFVHLLEQGFPIRATAQADRIILTSSPHH